MYRYVRTYDFKHWIDDVFYISNACPASRYQFQQNDRNMQVAEFRYTGTR